MGQLVAQRHREKAEGLEAVAGVAAPFQQLISLPQYRTTTQVPATGSHRGANTHVIYRTAWNPLF